MAEPFTFAFFLSAVLSGTTEALVGAATERSPRLIDRAKAAADLVERQPLSAMQRTVLAAVQAAAQDVIIDHPDAEDLAALLNHPPFAEELTRKLVYKGQPDFDRLRTAYLDQDAAHTSPRWIALEEPLMDFFDAIQTRLDTAPGEAGAILRELRKLTALTRLEESNQIVAHTSRQIALNTGLTAAGMQQLLDFMAQHNAQLGQLTRLLAQALTQQPAPSAPPPLPGHLLLTPDEETTLRLLQKRCNQLPLAADSRGNAQHRKVAPSLANVYVDLQTRTAPSLDHFFDRLRIPVDARPDLMSKLNTRRAKLGDRSAPADPLPDDAPAADKGLAWLTLANQEKLKDHPLAPWLDHQNDLARAVRPLSAVDALRAHPHLVLLGNPGSGKSTLVNHLAYLFARALTDGDESWQKLLGDHFPAPLFPLRVVLRQWSGSLKRTTRSPIQIAYTGLRQATGLTQAQLTRRLADPNTLVFFDGLDEVPGADKDDPTVLDRRRLIVDAVHAFCVAHPHCRILVTSRITPYQHPDYQLPDLPIFTLAPLDTPRIQRFVTLWYAEMARILAASETKAAKDRDTLLTAIGRRQDLAEMAGTPLLLTMLATVNARFGLPESRAELYHECVEQLLWKWEDEKTKLDDGELTSLLTLLQEEGVNLKRADVERVLWELTYNAHASSGKRTADLPAADLERKLAAIHPAHNQGKAWASRVVDLMAERGGLLIETDTGLFTFPHRTFQEYLAARWLLTQDAPAHTACRLAESDTWREVILLACGYLVQQGATEAAQPIILELTAGDDFTTPAARQRLLVGGQAWLEFTPNRATGAIGHQIKESVPPKLTALMQDRHAPAAQRLEAGLLLADLGILPPDLDAFIPVAAQKELGHDFLMARYPVTNAQFRRFMDAGGYEDGKPWWTDQAVNELKWDKDWRKGPRLRDNHRFNRATQPVVGISWYEAVAYCTWLTQELRTSGTISPTQEVRLPTEAQWHWAATAGADRPYAWLGDFAPWRTNSAESNLDQPTPVHMYPHGATPSPDPDTAIWDLCGNVWEWSQDWKDGKYPWLRGGAFYQDAQSVQASARYDDDPWDWYYGLGFRVVVVG